MTGRTRRAALVLDDGQRSVLESLAASHTAPAHEVVRARILLGYARGEPRSRIAGQTGVSRPTVYKCVDKALAARPEAGLRDGARPGREREITAAGKAWVVGLACRKPKEQGLAAELWTLSALAGHVRARSAAARHPSRSRAAKATVWRILNEHELRPHRVRSYLERRDPDFERKMVEVRMVYREGSRSADDGASGPGVYRVSVDEKPGVQALGLRAPDLPPVPGRHPAGGRDPEYVRHGTLSILAALDLRSGEIIANVERRHRSCEFVALLQRLDAHYPEGGVTRIVLDNHTTHTSRETMRYLARHPGHFEYVHTPRHASWLHLVEVSFSRMARTFLRHIRVESPDELKCRILQGIDEMNAAPVPYRWKKFGPLMSERV